MSLRRLRYGWIVLLAALLTGVSALAANPLSPGLPNGSFDRPVDRDCWPEFALAALNPSDGGSVQKQAAVTQTWLNHCQSRWRQVPQTKILTLLEYANISYPSAQPYAKKIKLQLRDGRKLRGLLAVKPGVRDLVIVRCGMFCDANEGSVSSMALMQIFEENPVNLLVLNSMSGADYARDNGISHIGGFDEGYQNLEVAQHVYERQGAYGLHIKKIHIMGASLGGLSSLFSSFFADATPEFSHLPLGTFLAVCPVVDTRAQFEEVLSSRSLAATLYKSQLRDLFKKIAPFTAPMESLLQPGVVAGPSAVDLSAALDLSAAYYERNWAKLDFAPYIHKDRRFDRLTMLEASSVISYANEFSPRTVVLHAKDDILVPWKQNSQKLLAWQNARLGVMRTEEGNHCAFSLGMGWPAYSQFLANSFGLGKALGRRRIELPPSVAAATAPGRWNTVVRSHYQWSVKPGAATAELKVWRFQGHRGDCDESTATFSPLACQRTETTSIPLAELRGLGIPARAGDTFAANRLERYLNVHTRILDGSGKVAVGEESSEPRWMESKGKFDPIYGVL